MLIKEADDKSKDIEVLNALANVAKFCWFNKPRFGGKVYCMECQKAVVIG